MDRARTSFRRRTQALLARFEAGGLLRFAGPDASGTIARTAPSRATRGAGDFLTGMAILVGYQWLGECLVSLLGLPVSGPVAGMVLLFATLVAHGRAFDSLQGSADGLLRHLPLYFVPAGVVGGCVAATSALLLASLFDASLQTALSLAPKSITAPVAMSVAERIGGLPSLTASLAVLTGIFGAVFGIPLLDWLGIHDDCIRGVALGTTSHGIGTARALQVSTEAGAFAGLAMALSTFASSIVVPWLVPALAVGA